VLDGPAGLSRSQVLACCALTHRMLHAPAVIRVSILVQGGAWWRRARRCAQCSRKRRAGRAASGRVPARRAAAQTDAVRSTINIRKFSWRAARRT